MQMIMPAAALSTPTLISSSFIRDPVPDSTPSSCSSPTIPPLPCSHSTSPVSTDHHPPPNPDHLLFPTVHDPPPISPLPLQFQPPPAPPDHSLPSHSCRLCSRTFSCGRALGGHMRAHGSFYALCEGAGSSADIMAKAHDHRYSDQKQNESNENEFLIDLSSNCKSETDEEDELMYVLRRKPKRNRRFADQDFTNEGEALVNKRNVDGDDPEFTGRIMPTERYKKPMFTCKLQDKAPPACTECGKEFNSWKALFGHMRCHPEREWRGIQPPAEYMSSMKAHKDSIIARNGSMESNRYIVVKPLQAASKHELLKRKEMGNQFRSTQSAPLSHDVNKANYNQSREDGLADDTIVGCIRGDEKLQWSSCRKQVMLEEEEESDTESIEAAYISNNKDEEEKCLHLLASFSRGKRSKRSHFTIKSLRSVQDQLVAKVVDDVQPKDEDLEMANCLVMLALAGSANDEGEKQEGGTVSKSDDDDEYDDDEGTVDDQLRLAWGSNLCATVDESKTAVSNLDGTNAGVEGGKYECTACKRSFKSHQALGGHRASHKKVKGCFAKTAADVEASPYTCKDGIPTTSTYIDTPILTLAGICKDQMATQKRTSLPDRNGDCKDLIATSSTYVGTSAYEVSGGHNSGGGGLNTTQCAPNLAENGPFQLLLDSMDGIGSRSSKLALHNPSKFHQCSICQRVFSSGQALGGHKRCHWAADKADRQITAISEMGTGISAMACVATPPAMAKITFFTRPPPVEEAVHQVKVLDIDLNLPAPLDVDPPVHCTNANVNTCKYNSTLGSLLSLGQCSNVTIQAPIDVDDDSFHSGGAHTTGDHVAAEPAAYSGASSPSSTTSIHVSEIGPCL